MAIVQNPIIGKASGSVGGVTFTTWKGKNVLKSKPTSVANPNTPGQKTQRSKLTLIVLIYRLIAGVIAIGYENLAIGKSVYNAFVSQNIQDATLGSSTTVATLIPASLMVSKGTIGTTPLVAVTIEGLGDGAALEFGDTIPVGGNNADGSYGVLWNETQNVWVTNTTVDTRLDAVVVIPYPLNFVNGDVIHAWLFFKSSTNSDVSDSAYNTTVVAV